MSRKVFYLILFTGILLFAPMFVFRTIGPVDFWWWMSFNLILLISAGLLTDKKFRMLLRDDLGSGIPKKILYGILTAVILYFVFMLGDYLSGLMFHFSGEQIDGVYGYKGDASSGRIFLLMLLIIGPGEEIFWRIFVQKNLEEQSSPLKGFIYATAIYTGIHIFTGNFMLIMAAMVAGIFWGWLYYRFRSPLLNIVSHIIWDITVFLVFPLN